MALNDLLTPDAVLVGLRASGKKQALQELASHAARLYRLDAGRVFETLLQRERLGSTGVGSGIAIPHGKLEGLDGLKGLFARFEKPIPFDAPDGAPVDVAFLLLAPESAGADHLKALARIARAVRDSALVSRIRASRDASALYLLLADGAVPNAA